MAAKRSNVPSTYFKSPSIVAYIFVFALLFPIMMAWLAPTSTPSFVYKPLADVIEYCGTTQAFWVHFAVIGLLAIHILEAACALTLCWNYGLTLGTTALWVLQTFVVGYFSLTFLVNPPTKFSRSKRS